VRALRRHRLFVLVAMPALLLRADAELGYRWQSWFNDSFSYVRAAVLLVPEPQRVSGYPVLLWVLSPFHSFSLITILQHLAGFGIGACVYWLARERFGTPAWVAVLAAVPVLYDGFQIQLEHLIMADVAYEALIVAAIAVLLSARRPGPATEAALAEESPRPFGIKWQRCAIAGGLLGLASVMRSAALPLLLVFLVFLLLAVGGAWLARVRAAGVLVLACAVPVVAYAGWFDASRGQFATTDSTGIFLYSRVMTFAQCDQMGTLTPELRSLCPTVPPSRRPPAEEYIWRSYSPLIQHDPSPFNPATNALARKFALRAIEAQPLDYTRAVLDDVWRNFGWSRTPFPDEATYSEYLFGNASVPVPSYPTASIHGYTSYEAYYVRGDPGTRLVDPFAAIIRGYQRFVWLPGTVFGLLLLLGLAGMVLRRHREVLLPWGVSLAMIVVPAATAEFDYRYVLPAVPLACLAAALAWSPAKAGDDQRDLALHPAGAVARPGG
jgi:hypothetical protein